MRPSLHVPSQLDGLRLSAPPVASLERQRLNLADEIWVGRRATGYLAAMTKARKQKPSEGQRSRARQLLHWATGDRSAEGKALAERTDAEVTERDATNAVRRVHGDLGVPATPTPGPESEVELSDVAEPQDARVEREDRASD